MRERNKKFLNNIGNLVEEINNQDLETVNGGADINITVVAPPENEVSFYTEDPTCWIDLRTVGIKCNDVPTFSKSVTCILH